MHCLKMCPSRLIANTEGSMASFDACNFTHYLNYVSGSCKLLESQIHEGLAYDNMHNTPLDCGAQECNLIVKLITSGLIAQTIETLFLPNMRLT